MKKRSSKPQPPVPPLNSLSTSQLYSLLETLSPEAKANLMEQCRKALPWTPHPGPQARAYLSPADELFYGGAAGGGKTDLSLGLALTAHRKTLFLRRESTQLTRAVGRLKELGSRMGGRWSGSGHGGTMRMPGGREIQLGGCEHLDDREKYQGHDDDFKCFDEIVHFLRDQYRFIIGWNRTDLSGQRCRVVCTGNPPTTPEGRWVVEEWAPWLDAQFADPAVPGELRWYTYLDDKLHWFRTGDWIEHKGERIKPRSRTFIPARVQDNPVYMATGYIHTLQSMPEPLRSQMLYGDFSAGVEDDLWQLIPTAWVQAAQARWVAMPKPTCSLDALGVDVARGGKDQSVTAKRFRNWIDRLRKRPGRETPDGQSVYAMILEDLADGPAALVNIDADGVGGSAYDMTQAQTVPMRNARAIRNGMATDWVDPKHPELGFANVRSAMYWHLRSLLDPEGDVETRLAIPPDPELLADLTAPRYRLTVRGIQVESKDSPKENGKHGGIRGRIGRSTDCGDAVVMACWEPTPRNGFFFSKGK